MSGLFNSLNSTVLALTAQSRAVEIAGKNLANVENPNYARQRVVMGDGGTVVTPDGAESLGLQVSDVEQMRDALLDRQVVRETSLTSYYTALQAGYQRAQAALGQTLSNPTTGTGATSATTEAGVSAALNDFFNAFQGLATNPTDPGQLQMVAQAANTLTDRLQLADQRVAQAQTDLDAQIQNDTSDANRLLQTVARLNVQIAGAEINHAGSATDLRDQRQAALESLAQKLPITVSDSTASQVKITVPGASGPVTLVDLGTVAATVAYDGTQITAGSPAATLALDAGSIQGAFAARTGAVQTLRDQLDQLASQLVTSVNAAYNPNGSGANFFAANGTAAGTIRSVVTSSTLQAGDGSAAGDNSRAAAIAALGSRKFSTAGGDAIDGTFSSFFSSTASQIGQALASATSGVTDQTAVESLVRSQRDSVSGVNLDEETANLVKYQRAFQASSRVFQVIDNLLDTVVNQLGRN